jgi:predicted outer membrane repeat protein
MPVSHVSFTPGYDAVPATPGVLYAAERGRAPDPGGGIDGTSWGDAVTDLQWLIDTMFGQPDGVFGGEYTEIWIEGTLHPDPERWAAAIAPGDQEDGRNNSFVLKSGVKLYGGFGGTEYGEDADSEAARLEGRSRRAESGGELILESVLSGELPGVGKAYHVVVAAGISGVELHDLSIRGGYASEAGSKTGMMINGVEVNGRNGGGLYCSGGAAGGVVLENLLIEDNVAAENGGGAVLGGNPLLNKVSFVNNMARRGGGAHVAGNAAWSAVRFIDNLATVDGGGLYAGGNFTLNGGLFSGNYAGGSGGGAVITGTPDFTDVTWQGNVAAGGGGYN